MEEKRGEDAAQKVLAVLQGGYDLHTHSSPCHFPRVVDDFTLIRDAAEFQMAGVLIKNHYESTGSRAALVNAAMPKGCSAAAIGATVLNWPVGGLNPYAVESAVRLGAKIVWMPTRDAAHSLKYGDMPGDFFRRPGISVFDEAGKLKKEVLEIMEIVAKHNVVLATGHISAEESLAVCEESVKRRIKTVFTHPEWERTKIPLETQLDLAKSGVKIEKCWVNIPEGDCTAEYMACTIRQIGPDNVFLTTDCGKAGQPKPIEGMQNFVELLLACGFTVAELRTMVCDVPASLL